LTAIYTKLISIGKCSKLISYDFMTVEVLNITSYYSVCRNKTIVTTSFSEPAF